MANRKRDLEEELSLRNPMYLQHYYLVNDIQNVLAGISDYSVVVDVGCGTKPYREFCTENVAYIGVDLDSENQNVDVISSAYHLPIRDDVIDYVLAFQVLEHLEEPNDMIAEAFRVLRSGGDICLTVPMSERLHEEPRDFFRFTEHGLTYLLEKNCFSDIVVTRQGTTWAAIGSRLSLGLAGRRALRSFIPIVNYLCRSLEDRRGVDVMNYLVCAKKR